MSEKQEILSYASLLPEKNKSIKQRESSVMMISPESGSRKKRTRMGRGRSSGHGKTCGRGQDGQKSRAGYSRRSGFEGGQMPLHRRLPKRGFTSIFKKVYQLVNIENLSSKGLSGEFGPDEMQKAGLVANYKKPVKILGQGDVTSAMKISADAFSESARSKIEAAGGSCTIREKVRKIKKNPETGKEKE